MRFTLFDLIVAIVLVSVGMVAATKLVGPSEPLLRVLIGSVVGLICYVSVSSVVYRRLQRPPLLLPRCPNCRDASRHYVSVSREWPGEVIVCGGCGSSIELQLDRTELRPAEPAMPRFRLLWPYSFGGRWQRLQ